MKKKINEGDWLASAPLIAKREVCWRQPIGFNRGQKKLNVVIDDDDPTTTTTNRTHVPLTIVH